MTSLSFRSEGTIFRNHFPFVTKFSVYLPMEELKLEPDAERHSSYSVIRGPRTSELFTFTEVKPGLAVIKLEPKGEIDLDPDGIIDQEPDDELDPLAVNTERDGSVIEQEDLPCPLAFLAVESKAEDGTWDSTAATMKVELNGETHGEQYGVHLEELDGVGKMTWNGYVELKRERGRPRKHVNMSEEEKLTKQRERNRLRKRRYRASKSQEALARERERNRLYMRKIRASLTNEEIKRQRETDRTHKKMSFMSVFPELNEGNGMEKWHVGGRKHKRKPVVALTPQQLERQRERNRIYMRKFRASLSGEELERRREKDRLLKRRAREFMKHQKQDITFQGRSEAVHKMLQSTDFWHYAAFVKEQNQLHLKNLHTTVMGGNLELSVESEEEEEEKFVCKRKEV